MNSNLFPLLDKGIYLEDSDILLDWNSSRDELLLLSQPQTEELSGGRMGLLWRNRHWLGGMMVTFYASLKKNGRLRCVEVWPKAGKELTDEFQRFSRHLTLHLGAATRKKEVSRQLSCYWKRGHIEISLALQGRSDRLGFIISYHGPEKITTAEQNVGALSYEQHLERLGLSIGQWHDLKNYLLDLQAGFTPIPPAGLLEHPVAQLAIKYSHTRDSSYLDQAAGKLVGSTNQAWLALDKS